MFIPKLLCVLHGRARNDVPRKRARDVPWLVEQERLTRAARLLIAPPGEAYRELTETGRRELLRSGGEQDGCVNWRNDFKGDALRFCGASFYFCLGSMVESVRSRRL